MITDLNSLFSSWLYTCNPISAHFKICRNSCVPNGVYKNHTRRNFKHQVWGVPCGQFFRWPTYSPIFRYQVWGVPGLPTFRWTSFPLFLRCQVRGVPGLPTFCWTSYPPIFEVPGLENTWSANISLDLISPIFEVPGLGNTWFAYFSLALIFPHQIESRQPWYMLDVQWSVIHIYPNKPYLNMGILLFGAHEYALVSRFLSIQGCWYCRFIISIWLDVVLRCSRHVWHHKINYWDRAFCSAPSHHPNQC